MGDSPITQSSLLIRIRDARDTQAWMQFTEIYAPLVYDFARKRGLQDADAADLTQDVLRAVAGAVDRLNYDPQRGSFRSWLFTVARNKLYDFLDSQNRHPRGSGDTAVQNRLEEQLDRGDCHGQDRAEWDYEYERRLFAWAAEQIRGEFKDSTWQAFWQTAVESKKPKDVADALDMTVGAVYIAKSRVLTRLKERLQQIRGE